MTNRSRYSTAPTYGMQKRSAQKKQAAPTGPVFPPVGPPPQGPYAPPAMPVQGQQNAWPPQAAAYAPQQPAYAAQAAGFVPKPGYMPGQPGFQPPAQQPVMPVQPLPYYPQQPYAPQPVPQEYAMRTHARRGDNWLQILLLAVLPVLFLLSMFVFKAPAIKIVFIITGLLSLAYMWMQRAFVSNARVTLSLVYGALIAVCIVSLITGTAPGDATTPARGVYANNSQPQLNQPNTTPAPTPESYAQMAGAVINQTVPTPTIAPESGENSAAWLRLQQFFDFWIANKISNMLDLTSPSWKAAQEKPEAALYLVMSNRVPLDYQFEKISNTEADSTRTITMTATIDKRNSRDPVKYRFQIVMLKVNNEWYVDPKSLASNEPVEETDGAAQTASTNTGASAPSSVSTPKPTATPGPKTKLYYNKKGGRYYHAQSDCPSVAKEYLPLTSFYYRDLNTTTFKHLLPCPQCDAPNRP